MAEVRRSPWQRPILVAVVLIHVLAVLRPIDVLFPVRLTENPGVPFVFFLPDFQYRYLHHLHDERGFRYFDDYNRQEGERARLVYVSSQSVLRGRMTPSKNLMGTLMHP